MYRFLKAAHLARVSRRCRSWAHLAGWLELNKQIRAKASLLPRIAPGIAQHPRARYLIVDSPMRMAVHPQRHPLAAHEVFPAIGVRGSQLSVRERAALEGAQRRRVVGDHHCWAGKWLRELHAQPVFRLQRPGDQIGWADAPVTFGADLPEVVHRVLRTQARHRRVAGSGKVRPHGRPQKAYAAEDDLVALQHPNPIILRRTHFLQGMAQVPTVKLVVAKDVQHWAGKDLPGPLDSTRLDIDVASQNDHIAVHRLRRKGAELIVQIGQQVNTHHHFSLAWQRWVFIPSALAGEHPARYMPTHIPAQAAANNPPPKDRDR